MTNQTTVKQITIKPQKKRTAEHLKPYQFKPGNNANPKGRPKSILTKRQRLQLLSEYAKLNPDKVNPVSAIHEHNLMEHVFDEKPQFQDNRTYHILVQGDEAKDRFNKLLEGKRPSEIEEGDNG